MKIFEFAETYAEEFHSCTFGPDHKGFGLKSQTAGVIRGCVAAGYFAGEAMNNNSPDGFDVFRTDFSMFCTGAALHKLPITYGQLDMCFQIGYNKIRNKVSVEENI